MISNCLNSQNCDIYFLSGFCFLLCFDIIVIYFYEILINPLIRTPIIYNIYFTTCICFFHFCYCCIIGIFYLQYKFIIQYFMYFVMFLMNTFSFIILIFFLLELMKTTQMIFDFILLFIVLIITILTLRLINQIIIIQNNLNNNSNHNNLNQNNVQIQIGESLNDLEKEKNILVTYENLTLNNNVYDSYVVNYEKKSCSICFDEYKSCDLLVILKCKHFFHSICLNRWSSINNSCPICRTT